MSSLRNAVQRRNHKERSQPLERSKWGLLEKHKDYSLRAKDHNSKKRKIKILQQKASERNEDEFYFGMMSSKTRGGVKIAQRGEDNSGSQLGAGKSLNQEVVKLMKTQDSAYLQTILQTTRRAIETLEREVISAEQGVSTHGKASNRKFFDDEDEGLADTVNEQGLDMDALDDDLDLTRKAEQEAPSKLSIRCDDEEEMDELWGNTTPATSTPSSPASKKEQHALEVKQRQLETLRQRHKHLTTALRQIDHQRARMNGSAGGVNKSGVAFRSRGRRR